MAIRGLGEHFLPGAHPDRRFHQQSTVSARRADGRGGGRIVFHDPEVGYMNQIISISIPFREVAILFIGIFATMMPALDWLQGQCRQA